MVPSLGKNLLFLSSLTADSGSGIRFWNMARTLADSGWPVTFLERKSGKLPKRAYPGIQVLTPSCWNRHRRSHHSL